MGIFVFIVLALLLTNTAMASQSRKDKQAELDAARESCERFYADYGNKMGGRVPLFYDLPECVTTFAFTRSSRNPN